MYGVEIQANIIQALMDGKTALAVPAWMYLAVVCPLLLIFFFLAQRQKLLPTLLTCLTLLALHMLVGRRLAADLLQLLCADQENEPAGIGVDILFTGESDARADARPAEAAENACPIVLASNLVYRGSTKQNREGELYYDTMHVDMVEEPYAALRKAGRMGYTNAFVAADGRIRYTKLFEDHNTNAESFAWSLYEIYENARGRQPVLPPTNDAGQLHFFYSGRVGEFSHVSLRYE